METHYAAYMDSIDKTELYNLMTLYGDDVVNFAYAIVRNRERAKDIAQEAFLKAYSQIDSFRGQSSMRTWLLAITRNLAVNELKSSYIRRIVLFEWIKPAEHNESAEKAYFDNQAESELWDIVLSLPIKLREALVLQVRHDMSMSELAELLQVSEGTVKSRLHRARKLVEAKWRGYGYEQS